MSTDHPQTAGSLRAKPMHCRRRAGQLLLFVAGFSLQSGGPCHAAELAYEATLATDYVFRGVSQTMSGPALQGGISADFGNGIHGCVWMSNIDYAPSGEPDDGADVEIDLLLGHTSAISERVDFDIAWVQYRVPGTVDGVDYDYDEWIATVTVDQRHFVTAGYSDDVFGAGGSAAHLAVSAELPLPRDLSARVTLGHYDLRNAYGAAYGYGALSVSRQFGLLSARLEYHVTSSAAQEIFYESVVTPRVVLVLAAAFD